MSTRILASRQCAPVIMFYNHDILSRRRSGLGIVWLAATLGDRSIVRRLTRREILGVNIDQACRYVVQPSEPLALRLSSQLMFGLVKLYGHKAELLYQDVSNVHSDVRRQTLILRTQAFATRHIDMRKAVSRLEAITVPLDLAFFTLDFDDFTTRLVGRWSVEPFQPRTEELVLDNFRTPTPMSFVAEEERITLPGRAFEEEEEELGLARGFGDEDELALVFGQGGFDDDEVEGLDLGLEGIEPSAAARPERLAPDAPEGIERRAVGDDTTVSMGPMVEWPELEERLAEEAARMEVGPVIEGIPTVTPARRPRDEEEAAEVEALLRAAPRRPRPTPLPSEDRRTELSEAQLRTARIDYEERMARERAARQAASQRRAAEAAVGQSMLAPPQDMSLHPMLSELWQMTVGEHLSSRRARFVQMRSQAALSPVDQAPPIPPTSDTDGSRRATGC